MSPTDALRRLVVEEAKEPPTPEEIAAIEAALGAPLPAPFLEFLKVANGGKLDYSFDLARAGETLSLCFYTTYSTRRPRGWRPSPGTMLQEVATERADKGIAREILPFAMGGGSSVAYLDLTKEGNGRVVAYVEGLPGWTGDPRSAWVTIAPDFPSYVAGLYLNLEELRPHGE